MAEPAADVGHRCGAVSPADPAFHRDRRASSTFSSVPLGNTRPERSSRINISANHATGSVARRTRRSLLTTSALLVLSAAIAATSSATEQRPSEINEGQSDIYTVRVDGTGLRRLTPGPSHRYDSPAWSKSGRWIAFSGPPCEDCPEAIFVVDLSRGGRVKQLLGTVPGAARPSWAPSGRYLTFVGGESNAVFTIGRPGTGQRQLTDGLIAHDQSVWSPDGRQILYTSQQRNGLWDISVMGIDGSRKRNLTATQVSEEQPAWSHDAGMIAFTRQTKGRWAIFAMPEGGGRARRDRKSVV